MHEMSITQEIVTICLQHAEGKTILAVTVEIGALSGVVPEAVAFCFTACTADTPASQARLEMRPVAGRGRCQSCGTEQPIEHLFDACPQCGSFALEILSGEEMRVVDIEVAD